MRLWGWKEKEGLQPCHEDGHDGLDGVHAVLGFIEDDGLRAFEHLVGDLHLGDAELLGNLCAGGRQRVVEGGQAVQEDGILVREIHELLRHAVGLKQADALGPDLLGLAHRDPDVGIDHMSTADALLRIVGQRDGAAVLGGNGLAGLHDVVSRPALLRSTGNEVQAELGTDDHQRAGDVVLCGASYGRVRSMTDTLDVHKRLTEAGPGVPVLITGLDVAPEAGSRFVVLDDIAVARQIAEERAKRAHEIELAGAPSHVTLESLFERINSAKSQQTLNVIIRADVRGSIEAIRKELGKLEHPEVKLKILQATVGGISEADVQLADASDAIILGFNSVPDEGARALAEAKKVQIRRYDVIYKLSEDIRAALEGMLKPEEQVKELGRALVQRTFNITRVGTIAGCRVLFGSIERDCHVRVIRNSRVIGEYLLETLKRERDDAKEVREGYECGVKLKNFNDVKEGDVLEAYKIEEVARTF